MDTPLSLFSFVSLLLNTEVRNSPKKHDNAFVAILIWNIKSMPGQR